MSKASQELPRTLGALHSSSFSEARLATRSVKDELRNNLICKIQRGEALFPGILGYEDTVVPQVINAVLSRHNFILLGLRGQAKTRLIRQLTSLLDETHVLTRVVEDLHTLALRLCRDLPRHPDPPGDKGEAPRWRKLRRDKLRDLVRFHDYDVADTDHDGVLSLDEVIAAFEGRKRR